MPKKSIKEYMKVRDSYMCYIRNYKYLNKGSLLGATSFGVFYFYKTYSMKYMDPHRITAHSYK